MKPLKIKSYEEIDEIVNGRKLFLVSVEKECTVPILAIRGDDAQAEAETYVNEILEEESAEIYAKSVNGAIDIPRMWLNQAPYGEDNITCEEYFLWTKEKAIRDLAREINDKRQLKLPLD